MNSQQLKKSSLRPSIDYDKSTSQIIFFVFFQIIVIIATLILLGFNIYGFAHLKQDFDLNMYIPSDSYAHQFSDAKEKYFPVDGQEVKVFCGRSFAILQSINC